MWKQQISSKGQRCTVELSKVYLAMCIFNQIIGRFQQYCETTKWSFYCTLLKWALFFESSGFLCGGDLHCTLVLFRKQLNPSSLFIRTAVLQNSNNKLCWIFLHLWTDWGPGVQKSSPSFLSLNNTSSDLMKSNLIRPYSVKRKPQFCIFCIL